MDKPSDKGRMPAPQRFTRKCKSGATEPGPRVQRVLDGCYLSASSEDEAPSAPVKTEQQQQQHVSESDVAYDSLEEGEIREDTQSSGMFQLLGYFFPDFFRQVCDSGLMTAAVASEPCSRKRPREEDPSAEERPEKTRERV